MGDKERSVIRRVLKGLNPDTQRLFRFNAGKAWTGETVDFKSGFLVLRNPRRFHGAPEGFPDLAGWETITVTQEMVGQKIAVFRGVEVKATGTLSAAQRKFKSVLERMGGIFEVAKSCDSEE